MYEHRKIWPITVLARVLQVGTSGYYAWIRKPNSPHHDKDAKLQGIIRSLFENSRGTYGSPRIHQDLLLIGYRVGRKRIERLMREMRISARRPRRFVRTTDSDHDNPIAPNLLNQNFHIDTPNVAWVGDITYIHTDEGWVFLATTLDFFSRTLVGGLLLKPWKPT